jgi:hypothetical protein
MQNQLLIPFKAKFQLNLENDVNKIFSKEYWDSLFENKEKVSGNWLAKISLSDFKVPQLKKDANIQFNTDFIKNTYEDVYTIDMYNSKIRIQLDSYEVTILQYNNLEFLFSYKDGSTYTTKTDENFKLIKIEK